VRLGAECAIGEHDHRATRLLSQRNFNGSSAITVTAKRRDPGPNSSGMRIAQMDVRDRRRCRHVEVG